MRSPQLPAELLAGPFTTEEAHRAGLTNAMLLGDSWRRLYRDVWIHVDVPETLGVRLAAARLILAPDAVAWSLTAAWLYGLDVRRLNDLDVHASFAKGCRPRSRPGLRVCQETLLPEDIWDIQGRRLTSPVRTVFDCLRFLRGAEGLVVADAMTHSGRATVDEIAAYFAAKKGLRNLRIGAALVPQIEPKSESPGETRMCFRMTQFGLPRPEAQIEVFKTVNGRQLFVARLDAGYKEQRTAAEYDGSDHWKQRRHDDRRRDDVRDEGWDVFVYSNDDIWTPDNSLERRIARSLRRNNRRV